MIILKIKFIPTQYINKNHFIYKHKLTITIIIQKTNKIQLIINYFKINIKKKQLSKNKNNLTFIKKLILQKLKKNISIYLKINNSKKTYHKKQTHYFSTNLPNLPTPNKIYIHTFNNINNLKNI